jgi:hypothetical protein
MMLEILETFVSRLEFVEQSEKHQPEGNVLNHSLQVLNYAFRESEDFDLVLAALLHDIGKYEDKLKHHEIGARWLCGLCSRKTIWLVHNHMRIHKYLNGETKKLSKCKKLTENVWFGDLIQLARWDHMGRNPNKKMIYDPDKICLRFEKLKEK